MSFHGFPSYQRYVNNYKCWTKISEISSKIIWSSLENLLNDVESKSNTPYNWFPFISGITISLLLSLSQAICPANWWTSSTITVFRVDAALPQTPLSRGMLVQAILPWNGPKISSLFLNK